MVSIKADGAAGARRAAALLGIAACAETTHTTMSEDAAKVDMKLSFRNVFQPEKLLTIHAQVKSGKSYRLQSSNLKILTLNIDADTLTALSGSSIPGLIVWVPPKPVSRIYWHANDPRRKLRTPVRISRHQYVRPSLRYDLTRLSIYSSWHKSFARQATGSIDDALVMERAKLAYKKLKKKDWVHPLVGRLIISRLAWRHITRLSKATHKRILSLRAVPYLKTFLNQAPDRYVCNQGPILTDGRWTIEVRYILCWYREALSISGKSHSLLLRIKEEIKYPSGWQNHPLGIEDIKQNATLASWWCKKEK